MLDISRDNLLNNIPVLYNLAILESVQVEDMLACVARPTLGENLGDDIIAIHKNPLELHVEVRLSGARPVFGCNGLENFGCFDNGITSVRDHLAMLFVVLIHKLKCSLVVVIYKSRQVQFDHRFGHGTLLRGVRRLVGEAGVDLLNFGGIDTHFVEE